MNVNVGNTLANSGKKLQLTPNKHLKDFLNNNNNSNRESFKLVVIAKVPGQKLI